MTIWLHDQGLARPFWPWLYSSSLRKQNSATFITNIITWFIDNNGCLFSKTVITDLKCVQKKVDWAKYHNRDSSKSIWVIKLSFCQNDSHIRESFWQNNSLVTHILFERCLLWYLAQSTFFWTHFSGSICTMD